MVGKFLQWLLMILIAVVRYSASFIVMQPVNWAFKHISNSNAVYPQLLHALVLFLVSVFAGYVYLRSGLRSIPSHPKQVIWVLFALVVMFYVPFFFLNTHQLDLIASTTGTLIGMFFMLKATYKSLVLSH